MNDIQQSRHGWVIVLTLLIALLLMMLPLPSWIEDWRPEWLLMVLIYWCLALPHRVGVGSAWLVGLIYDEVSGGLLGVNALGFGLIAYICIFTHRQVRLFPLWQQALFAVLPLFFVLWQTHFWIGVFLELPPLGWTMLQSTVSSVVLWPWIFIILRDVRRRAAVS